MQEYATMRDALNSTGRPIVFSLWFVDSFVRFTFIIRIETNRSGWQAWYAPSGATLGNLWRISGDVVDFKSMLNAININAPLAKYASCGSFNDPDS